MDETQEIEEARMLIIYEEADLAAKVYGPSPLRDLWPEIYASLHTTPDNVFGVSPELLGLANEGKQ